MIFNFDEKSLERCSWEHKVFHLPPSNDFALHFFDGFLSKFDLQELKLNPELLGGVKIITSNKRLVKQLEVLFENRGFVVLPRILDLENLSELFHEQPVAGGYGHEELDHFDLISELERTLLLSNLIESFKGSDFKDFTEIKSFELASSLISIIDELNANNFTSNDLLNLTDEDLPEHLQRNLVLLRKVLKSYEKTLARLKLLDKQTKYLFTVDKLIHSWQLQPCSRPIILVGSTGSRLATAKLMKAVTALPQGLVVLPGLDTLLTERGWNALTPDHPQYSFISLCTAWRLEGSHRNIILKAPPWEENLISVLAVDPINIRRHLFSLLMRPGPVTHEWITEGKLIVGKVSEGLKDVALIEANNSREEAAAICVAIKEAVTNGSTVALVTPSKLLARRVTAELKRWDIIPNNSLGINLGSTKFGIFFRLGALVLETNFHLNNVISLLQNNFCRGESSNHDLNISKLQEAYRKNNNSFLDLVESDWLLSQEQEFIDWYNWLLDIFKESISKIGIDTLGNTFSLHQTFLQRLMNGHQPNKITSIQSVNKITDPNTDAVSQFLKIVSGHFQNCEKVGKFKFCRYRKVLEKLLQDIVYDPVVENKSKNVFIWGTIESRTQSADVVVLAGLNEGMWPNYNSEDIWLSRSIRGVLGINLFERKVGLSAHDFQQGAMAKMLILSRSKRNNNSPTVASRWLIRLENLLNGLGVEGKKCFSSIKLRGSLFSKLASEIFQSSLLIDRLTSEVKSKAARPAPVPPLTARPSRLSVTEIATLIKNPYAIYAKKVLNLKKLENFEYTSDPRNKGNLIHATLEQFIFENYEYFPDSKEACDLLSKKFNSVLEKAKIPVEIKSVWKAQFENRIKPIISLEEHRRLIGKPYALEAFGKFNIKLKNGEKFLVTAKADRVDKGPDGFFIYDYKTGQISKQNLEKFSPQLDIEALMLFDGAFGKVSPSDGLVLALIGLGNKPNQYEKTVTEENLEQWTIGLIKIIEKMKIELSAFEAYGGTLKQNSFPDDFHHLSRFGEWNDDEPANEIVVELPVRK